MKLIIYLAFAIFFCLLFIDGKDIRCGDNECHGNGIETCFNCEKDCGKCDLAPIFSCKTAGHFALTFDDGPTENTDEILDILKEYKVVATFFVLGQQVEKEGLKSKLRRAFKEGHTIASHTYDHAKMTDKSDQQVIQEIKRTEDLIYDTIGKRPLFFRFPYLSMDARVQAIVKSLGYYNIQVSVDSFDWKEKTGDPEKIYSNIMNGVKDSDATKNSFISLQHDTTLPRISKIPRIINFIREKKYKFVNMETCLGLNTAYQSEQLKIKDDKKNYLNSTEIISGSISVSKTGNVKEEPTASKLGTEKSYAFYPILSPFFFISLQLAVLLIPTL